MRTARVAGLLIGLATLVVTTAGPVAAAGSFVSPQQCQAGGGHVRATGSARPGEARAQKCSGGTSDGQAITPGHQSARRR